MLMPGARVGPYEVVGPLGAGGMGEVYRARDVKLGRNVALKTLPEPVAADPERLGRFEREARTLAALNHSHIAQIYGFEERGAGSPAVLVMELVEGEDLAERIVLFEMLSGRRAFVADTVAETLSAVLRQEPDLTVLPASVPPHVRWLIQRCLQRDPTLRLRDIGDARLVLDSGSLVGEAAAGHAGRRPDPRFRSLWVMLAAAAGVFAGATLTVRLAPTPASARLLPHLRFHLAVNESNIARFRPYVSPDGRRIAYVTNAGAWIRWLDRSDPPRQVAKLEELLFLFWSPDGEWLGLVTREALWKLPSAGGEPLRVASIASLNGTFNNSAGGIVWLADGRLVFTTGFTGLLEVSSLGGEPAALVTPDTGVDFHGLSALPENGLLYAVHAGEASDTLEVFRGGRRHAVYHGAGQHLNNATYSPTGHILFERTDATGGIWALPFSSETLRTTGPPFMIVGGNARLSLSADGMLLATSIEPPRPPGRLALVGRDGHVGQFIGPTLISPRFVLPTLSPDESRVASTVVDDHELSLWVFGLTTDSATRVAERVSLASGVWSGDGKSLIIQTGSTMCFSGNCCELSRALLDGSRAPENIAKGWGAAMSPDGRFMMYSGWHAETDWDLEYRNLITGETKPFVGSPGFQFGPRFSPDGRYVAYVSRESGRVEDVYVATFPDATNQWRISHGGGYWPVWQQDGRKLFFVQGHTVREVAVSTSPVFALGTVADALPAGSIQPSTLFDWPDGFDVTADGSRFVVLMSEGERPRPVMTVIQNWLAGVPAPPR
jgi:Tol biopolymer transport system component